MLGRLVVGYIYFAGSFSNPPSAGFGWIPDWIRKEAQYAQIPPVKWLLESVVLPNMTAFLWLTYLIGFFIAATILLGVCVGLTGGIATFWAAVISIGSYPVPQDEPPYAHQLYVLLPLVLWLTRAGRVWGVDQWLRPRLEGTRWRWLT